MPRNGSLAPVWAGLPGRRVGIFLRLLLRNKELSSSHRIGLDEVGYMALTRSSLSQLTDPTAFLWSAGIEDTFITDPWPETGRILDEYELTGHYQYWKQDINLLKELGVKVV